MVKNVSEYLECVGKYLNVMEYSTYIFNDVAGQMMHMRILYVTGNVQPEDLRKL
jgi:hypothetical protein